MKYIYNVYKKYKYYRVCPYCGARLDPGEKCDCRKGGAAWAKILITR